MNLDAETCKKVEAVGWTVFFCSLVLFFGHFFIFLGVCWLIRYAYLTYKKQQISALDPTGKFVLITGCDSGFGHGLARRLYERGFNVLATCLQPESGGGAELSALGAKGGGSNPAGKLMVIPLDVADDASVSRCLDVVRRECQNTGLWGLVNNAGLNFIGDAELTTMEQYLLEGNINLYGAVRTCKAFLPLLRQAKGRIVNVTSAKGLLVCPSCAAYCATKFGLEAFSDSLRLEMEQFGVRVSVIEPCNFGGITGCLNDAALRRIKGQLDEQWEEASEEVRQLYGPEHLPTQLEEARKTASTSAPTIEPVLQAFEDALCNPTPDVRYLVKGSNSFFDFYYVLCLIHPYLPQTVFDKIRAYFMPYHIYK